MVRGRLLVAGLVFCWAVVQGVCGASGVEIEGLDLFRRVRPPVEADRGRVVVFFSFTCPHCYRVVPGLTVWADTLPKGVDVRFAPMIGRPKDAELAHLFFVCLKLFEGVERAEMVRWVLGIGVNGEAVGVADQFRYLLSRVSHDPDRLRRFRELWGGAAVRAEVMRSIDDWQRYVGSLQVVPSVVISGEYVVTPDDAPMGGEVSFLDILNGFVSRLVEGVLP